jgi:hypothetical protein
MPSSATEDQSSLDATGADQDRYTPQAGVTETDPVPGEATDVPGDVVAAEDDDVETFEGFDDDQTFEDLHTRQTKATAVNAEAELVQRAPVRIFQNDAERDDYMAELVPIIPRRTQQRVSINGEWWNFIKGQEQFVPRSVMEHIRDKGLI